jgi:hypothetical protein
MEQKRYDLIIVAVLIVQAIKKEAKEQVLEFL